MFNSRLTLTFYDTTFKLRHTYLSVKQEKKRFLHL